MWILTMRSPLGEPREYILRTGKMTIGRKSDNDIFVPDPSASRLHAEILYQADDDAISIRDAGSTNGTFVNRERLIASRLLKPQDQIRIGEHVISVTQRSGDVDVDTQTLPGTQPLTRDLLLESIDQHTILLYEVAARLNTIVELDIALREVGNLVKLSMGADKCEVILAEQFADLPQTGFAATVARQSISQRVAVLIPDTGAQTDPAMIKSAAQQHIRSALCVPVASGEEVLALLYVYKTRPLSHPFDQRDLQLAVAIGHQASLTIQRTRLLEKLRQEQQARLIFQRFLAPEEAEGVLPDYLRSGKLPEMAEKHLTILFADMRGATAASARLGPQRFGALLSKYFQEMMHAVFDQKGLLVQFTGDGLLAVFGMFDPPDPEVRAVQTALNIVDRITALNQAEHENLDFGLGLHTGPVVAGYINVSGRYEFIVLGQTVNVAQQLEQLATTNRVLISPDMAAIVGAKFKVRPLDKVEIKGGGPFQPHEVLRG